MSVVFKSCDVFNVGDLNSYFPVTSDINCDSQEHSKHPLVRNAIVDIDNYAPDPTRAVYLLTQSRRIGTRTPSRRVVREINKSRLRFDNRRRLISERGDAEEIEIRNIGLHTDEFNDFLKKHPKLSEKAVEMVMHRMKANNIDMNTETYNLLLEMVVDVPGPTCYNIYEDFMKNIMPPTTEPNIQTYKLLFLSCERNRDFDKVFFYYNHMRLIPNLNCDASFYNTLLTHCSFLQDEAKAAFIVEEMRERHIDPDVHTYNCLLNIFADAPYEVQFKTFEDMLKRKVKPNRRTYNSLMSSCQKSGDYERAFQFFEELKSDGLVPDVVTYNIVFVLCHDRLDAVLGVGSHTNVIRNREQHEIAMKAVGELFMAIFAEMEVCKVLPNTFTYNAILRGLSRCHDMRLYDVFNQMKQDSRRKTEVDPMDDLIQTWMSANSDIRSLPKILPNLKGDDENTTEEFEASMSGKWSAPNLETYMIMIEAASVLGMFQRSCAFYDEMRAAGIQPTKEVISKILEICAAKQDREKAYATLEDAKKCGIQLDVSLINGLLNVFAECADRAIFDELTRLNNENSSLDVNTVETYNLMLKGCLKLCDLESAMRLYRELCNPRIHFKGPNSDTYAVLFDICSQCKDIKTANELIKEMKSRHFSDDIHAYCRYMNVCVEVRDSSVIEIFYEMKRHGPTPNLEAYTILLSYHLRRRDPVIVQTFDEMKAAGIEPDIRAFNIMLDYFGEMEDTNSSLRLFDELKSMWLSPDIETFNALMKCFAKTGTPMIHKIFEEMTDAKIAPDHITFSILAQHKAGFLSLTSALEQQLVYVNKAIM